MDAWYTTALDIEERLGSEEDDRVHVFVEDVVKSSDTVDKKILDCVWNRLGFRHVFLNFMQMLDRVSNLRLELEMPGLGTVASRKVAR